MSFCKFPEHSTKKGLISVGYIKISLEYLLLFHGVGYGSDPIHTEMQSFDSQVAPIFATGQPRLPLGIPEEMLPKRYVVERTSVASRDAYGRVFVYQERFYKNQIIRVKYERMATICETDADTCDFPD